MPERIAKLVAWQAGVVRWMHRVTLSLLLIAFVLVVVVAVAIVVGSQKLDELAQAKDAVCTYKMDLQRRADAGDKFLREHPEGIAGIPVGTLRVSIANQRKAVRSLAGLDCGEGG